MSARNADRARSTRERILEVAATMFAESGYAGTSLNRILQEAGTTKGGFYFHFESKEALAVAVVDYLRERWLASTMQGADGGVRGIDRLRAMAEASTDAYHRMPGYRAIGKLCLHLLTVRPDLGPELRNTFGAWIDATEAAFRQAQAEGDIVAGSDARALAEVTVAAFTGMQEISELMSGGADLDRRVDMYVSLLMQLLGVSRVAGESGGSVVGGKEPR
jgi:AcrR family transcriptional regulator